MTVATKRLIKVKSMRVGTTHFGVDSFFWYLYAIKKMPVMTEPLIETERLLTSSLFA